MLMFPPVVDDIFMESERTCASSKRVNLFESMYPLSSKLPATVSVSRPKDDAHVHGTSVEVSVTVGV